MLESNQLGSTTDLSSLGALKGDYRVRKSVFWKIFLFLAMALFLLVGVASYLVAPDVGSIFICTLPLFLFAFIFLMVLRDAFLTGNDELRIYENGFAYRSRNKTQICLWEEIKEFQKGSEWQELLSVEKTDGDLIIFADDPLPEKKEIIRRFDERLMRPESGKQSDQWKDKWDEYRAELAECQRENPSADNKSNSADDSRYKKRKRKNYD